MCVNTHKNSINENFSKKKVFIWKLVKIACPNQIDILGDAQEVFIINIIRMGIKKIKNISEEFMIVK